IHRTHEEFPDVHTRELVSKAIRYLFPAMVGSSLSTIVIFLPFALMSGVAGAYFRVLTDTMIITLVCSFFVTWICLPALYLLFSPGMHEIQSTSKHVRRRTWVYTVIGKPAIAIGCAAAIIIVTAVLLPRLPSGFLPEMDEGSIVLDFSSPAGTSLEDTDAMLAYVDRVLGETPEVESFSRRTGTQMGFFITEPNRGDYLIQLKKNRKKKTEEVSDEIRKRIEAALPSLRVDFGQVVMDMLGDLMSSVQPVDVKIFGSDAQTLYRLAEETAGVVEQTAGTADVFNGIVIAGPELTYRPNVEALGRYQLSPQDFQFQMQTKIEGASVGSILETTRLVNIRMIERSTHQSMLDLRHTSLFLPDGRLKPIGEFAEFGIKAGVAEIERENLQQMVSVTARLNNRDLGSTLDELRKKISSTIHLPSGYQIVYGGSYAEQQQAFKELLTILLLAVVLVFTVILFLFRKIRVALAIMAIAILGIGGCVAALYVTGTPLNVGSYTGIIMIIGIIGENAIFTYLQFDESMRSGNAKRDDAIAYAISTRLRPKLMTALGAITALVPLALGVGTGAQMHQPLAIAIIGGLIVALPLLLVVLPTLLRVVIGSGPTASMDE
ncbi:MAG TPA: efflux RND transporter permease subunit, partial [Bacteroidota bacterium]|nr:efflux RND transporter permease subunit [Bacteroidota bacterium]